MVQVVLGRGEGRPSANAVRVAEATGRWPQRLVFRSRECRIWNGCPVNGRRQGRISDFTHAAVRMANSIHESGGRVRMRENGKTSYWLNNVIVIALNGKLQTAAMYGKSDCFREMKQEAARSCGMKRQSAALMMSTLGQPSWPLPGAHPENSPPRACIFILRRRHCRYGGVL